MALAACGIGLLAGTATAAPIEYIFTGIGSWTLNGIAASGSFIVTIDADTSNIFSGGGEFSIIGATTFVSGSTTVTLTGDSDGVIETTATPGLIAFVQETTSPFHLAAEALTGSPFETYDLSTAFPLTSGGLSINAETYLTSGGDLVFADADSISALSFQATTDGAVPEAPIWAMMFAGFAGLAFLGYRRAAKIRGSSAGGLRQLVACVAALLWLAVEVGGRADAAVTLQTPSGLDFGDPFRFVFVTDGIRDATSTNIADYDSFVNSEAGGASYNGLEVNWLAIASTDSVDAIDHVGQATAPVYLSDGTLVTTSTTPAGLWSRQLVHAINLDLAGHPVDPVFFVWTGTNPFGTGFGGPLGSPPTPQVGSVTDTGDAWISSGRSNILDLRQLYGISSVLTVPATAVPEPSTPMLLGVALTVGLAIDWTHRRRAQRRQRLVRPLATTA